MNPGFGTCYPLPPRDSQGRQTAASMRLGGNQKAKPSRGEGRERTGGRAATEPQTRCWRGPKEADHGATEPRLCSPWLGGPHTPSSVKQFKNWKNWPPHLPPATSHQPLPHLGRGKSPDGSPRASASPLWLLKKMKDSRNLWGLSTTCPREQESRSLSKSAGF